jgi:hypothetical protein
MRHHWYNPIESHTGSRLSKFCSPGSIPAQCMHTIPSDSSGTPLTNPSFNWEKHDFHQERNRLYTTIPPSFVIQWLALLIRKREITRSNLGLETGYAEFPWFSSVPPNKCRGSTLISHDRLLHRLPILSFNYRPSIRRYILCVTEKSSLNKLKIIWPSPHARSILKLVLFRSTNTILECSVSLKPSLNRIHDD